MALPESKRTEPAETPAASPRQVVVDPRILQANERTLLAWVRTAVGLMAFGFVIARLGLWLRQFGGTPEGTSPSVLLGATVVGFGASLSIAAAVRFRAFRLRLLRGEFPQAGGILELAVALGVAGVGILTLAYLLTR